MALDAIITEIGKLVAATTGAGAVLEYYRYTKSEQERNAAYLLPGVKEFHPSIVRRESSAARDRGAGADNVRDAHLIVVHCYRAMTSAADSEKKLQVFVEDLRKKLRANRKLPAAAGWLSAPPQVRAFNEVMFTGVVCWHAEVTVIAEDVMQGG